MAADTMLKKFKNMVAEAKTGLKKAEGELKAYTKNKVKEAKAKVKASKSKSKRSKTKKR